MSDDTHRTIRIDEGFLKEFPDYARKSVYISDGTHDAHGAHDVYFNRMARDIAPIRLTGKFGSEVVRTRKLIPWMNFPRHLLQPNLVPFLNEASSLRHSVERPNPLSRVVGDEIAWYEYGRVAVEQSALVLRTPYMDNRLVKLMFQAGAEIRASRDLQSSFVIDKSSRLEQFPRTGDNREGPQPAKQTKLSSFVGAIQDRVYLPICYASLDYLA